MQFYFTFFGGYWKNDRDNCYVIELNDKKFTNYQKGVQFSNVSFQNLQVIFLIIIFLKFAEILDHTLVIIMQVGKIGSFMIVPAAAAVP